LFYGFDIGGTKIAFSVYDKALTSLYKTEIPTPAHYDILLSTLIDMVNDADRLYEKKGNVGIGFPGNIKNDLMYCSNMPALQGKPLVSDLTKALARTILVENDANCFLLSECYGGASNGCQTALGVTLGTGVGGAVFVNNSMLHGLNSNAGEIGHYPIPATMLVKYPDLPLFNCACGHSLCFERYVSGTGLENLYQHYADKCLSGREILASYQDGDATACRVVGIFLDILASGVAVSVLVLDPEVIVFGGGLSGFPNLVNEIAMRLPEHLLSNAKLPKLATPKFGGDGGVRGAALLNYLPLNKS